DAELHDAGVAALTVGVARGDLVEELPEHAASADDAGGAAPRGERATLPERDHAIRPAAELLGLGVRGADRLALDQCRHQVAEQRAAMGRRPVELHPCDAVAHWTRRSPSRAAAGGGRAPRGTGSAPASCRTRVPSRAGTP